MHPTTPGESRPENVRTYLELTRLLDGLGKNHPEVSAPLRLTLFRARRDGQIGSLDLDHFRAALAPHDRRTPATKAPVVAAS